MIFREKLSDFFKSTAFLEMIKFGIVGLLNTLLSLTIIFVLFNLLHSDYRIANIAGYSAGIINSFIWNKLWTFRSQNSFISEIILFILVFLLSYGLQFGSLVLLVELLKLNVNLATVTSMIVYTVINYLGNRFFTFKKTGRTKRL